MPKIMNAVILFADMVESSTLSYVLEHEYYDNLVSKFQETAFDVVADVTSFFKDDDLSDCGIESHYEASMRGDELQLIMARLSNYEKENSHLCSDLVSLALQISVRLKRRWLIMPENVKRINAGQPPLSIAIGIHSGPVVVGKHIRFQAGTIKKKNTITAEGYAINLAKRVETASRNGKYSKIFLTRPIYNVTQSDFRQAFVRVDVPQMKGIPEAPAIYEAKGVGHFDDKLFPKSSEFNDEKNIEIYEKIVESNPDELWLLLDLAHRYFDIGKYEEASQKYKSVINVDPTFAPAYTYLGRAYFRNYYIHESQSVLEQAIEITGENARANNYLAVCLRRLSIILFYNQRKNEAEEYIKRAISYHDRACRIVTLEKMDFPWAINSLNWSIAQCKEMNLEISNPYDIHKALKISLEQYEQFKTSEHWDKKVHLVLHTIGYIYLQLKNYDDAEKYFNESLVKLEERNKDIQKKPDTKGYAERKAELFFHIGLCILKKNPKDGMSLAIDKWKEAKDTIITAWGDEAERAYTGQYWIYYCVNIAGKDYAVDHLVRQ